MSEAKKVVAEETMEYVEIPEKDLFDQPHHSIWNVKKEYKPGVHMVPKEEAEYIRERLRVFQAEQIRQLRPNSDPRVQNNLPKS